MLTIFVGWGWGGTKAVEESDHGASHEEHELGPHCPPHHDLTWHAQTGLPGGRYREDHTVWEIPASEHHLPRIWSCLQNWPQS